MCLVGSCAGEVKDFGCDLPAYQAHLTMAGRETAHCGGFVWTSQQSGSNAAKSSLPKCGRQARSPRLSPVCSEAGHRRPGAAGASLHFTLLMGEEASSLCYKSAIGPLTLRTTWTSGQCLRHIDSHAKSAHLLTTMSLTLKLASLAIRTLAKPVGVRRPLPNKGERLLMTASRTRSSHALESMTRSEASSSILPSVCIEWTCA